MTDKVYLVSARRANAEMYAKNHNLQNWERVTLPKHIYGKEPAEVLFVDDWWRLACAGSLYAYMQKKGIKHRIVESAEYVDLQL